MNDTETTAERVERTRREQGLVRLHTDEYGWHVTAEPVRITNRRTSTGRFWLIRWPDQTRECCGEVLTLASSDRRPWWPDEESGEPRPRSRQCGTCGSTYAADFDAGEER